jgi:predicted peroxiredoxin
MLRLRIFLFVASLIMLNISLCSAQEIIPHFEGKNTSAFIINSLSIILDSAAIDDYLDFKVDKHDAIDNDLATWSQISGNKLILIERTELHQTYRVVKKKESLSGKRLALMVSEEGKEELISPIGLAWAAALSGMDVDIYFQGPAVKVLDRGYEESFNRSDKIFNGAARNGLDEIGHISTREKIEELHRLGARFYVCEPSMNYFKIKRSRLFLTEITMTEHQIFMQIVADADIRFNL